MGTLIRPKKVETLLKGFDSTSEDLRYIMGFFYTIICLGKAFVKQQRVSKYSSKTGAPEKYKTVASDAWDGLVMNARGYDSLENVCLDYESKAFKAVISFVGKEKLRLFRVNKTNVLVLDYAWLSTGPDVYEEILRVRLVKDFR